ncbi:MULTISPECIES: MGDG synthase family glycosyltransferase [Bacillus]|uniref:MGDG synthase family glycosyltransferase n=1 Tax=Bacillus TaxID=1386 RepID=UPI001144E4A4|nr:MULTISPECIES: glycosyltransferase [Bacillus]
MEKRVLILSEAYGAGHTTAAHSLKEGILNIDPTIDVRVVEVGKNYLPFTSIIVNKMYLTLINDYPNLWRFLYTSSQNKLCSRWYSFVLYLFFYKKMHSLLTEYQPDIIICTHPFSNTLASKFKNNSTFILCTLVTELHLHGCWVNPEIDFYFVSSDKMNEDLQKFGTENERIRVTGLPTRKGFWNRQDKGNARAKLKLKNIPTVLIMGGGLGLGGMEKVAIELFSLKEEIQIIICTGNNIELKKGLEMISSGHPHIKILGYESSIHDWMDASDLLITKPGGSTCFEALVKGLPMIITNPISGHEEQNCSFLTNNDLAIHIEELTDLVPVVKEMLFIKKSKKKALRSITKFNQSIDPLASAKHIVKLLKTN